jgi:hypothetical protein
VTKPPRQIRQPFDTSEPTPERRAKAADVGHRIVGRRAVRALKTTADLLEDRGHLPRHLRQALDAFSVIVVEALNVNAADYGDGTARLVSGYNDSPTVAYGPREISDRALDARYKWRMIEREVPEHLLDVLEQLVAEETGRLQGRPKSLQRYGREFGWEQEKQAGAAGAMMAVDACGVLHHALKHGVGKPKK